MYQIEINKTYQGKTGGGWIKNAYIQPMQSGDFQIHTPDLPGCELVMSDHDNLIIRDYDGIVGGLLMSDRAIATMIKMQESIEKLYKKEG
jgi:hypothetical protein